MQLPSTPTHVGRPLNRFYRASYSPEFNIVIFAALLNLPWEFLQVPFFSGMSREEHWSGVKTCVRATLGDVMIMLVGYWIVTILFRRRHWVSQPRVRELLVFVGIGLGATVIIERLALAGAWPGSWSYSERMYVIPVVEVGLAPILQWLLLPLVAVWFARRQMAAGPQGRAPRSTISRSTPFEMAVTAGAGARHNTSADRCGTGEAASAFASYVFLLDGAGRVELLPHSVYVAVARAEAVLPLFAGKTFRLADWYVRHGPGRAWQLVSEWYGWVRFDEAGAFDPTALPAEAGSARPSQGNVDSTALPTSQERIKLQEALASCREPSGG